MRTVRCSGRLGGVVCLGGVYTGGCLPGGVVCLGGVYTPLDPEVEPLPLPPTVNRIKDRFKNISFGIFTTQECIPVVDV